MLLKRVYDHAGPEPRLSGIAVLHAGPRQRFSPRLVERGLTEGWLVIGRGTITLHVQPRNLVYRILRMPGYYCCFCGERLLDAADAKTHVAAHVAAARADPNWFQRFQRLLGDRAPTLVPDPQNPSGYRLDSFYECELEGEPVGQPGL